jgi:hypothetical protein
VFPWRTPDAALLRGGHRLRARGRLAIARRLRSVPRR